VVCRSPQQARDIIKAGADGIQIGTAFEIDGDHKVVREKVERMVNAVKEAAKERRKKVASKAKSSRFKKLHFPRFDLTNITRRFKKQKKTNSNENNNKTPKKPVQQPKK
jgi:hypothetical protein